MPRALESELPESLAQPRTVPSCTRLSPSRLSPLFLLGAPTEVFLPVQRTGLLAAPNSSQPFLAASPSGGTIMSIASVVNALGT